jgi:menaquinone-dependent protoporphyrinogen oxidase
MDKKILVAYASKYGSTKEIAMKIGEVLRQSGLQADVLPMRNIQDLKPYKAVILGSAIYVGKWQKDSVKFLHDNEKSLTNLPLWLFSSGPTGEGDPVESLDGQLLPPELQPIAERIQPRAINVFHGNIDPAKVNFIEKWAVEKVVKKPLGDYRKWESITSWASGIAKVLVNAVS